MSPPAVTRAVAQLEERLGTRLFVRTTRSVRLTESGERFHQDGRRILQELEEAENAAVGSHAVPQGELHLTAPVMFGRMYVTPVLGGFLDLNPQVSARTLYVDRNVNLMDEGLDVAIRIGNLPDSSLTAIRVGTVRWVLFTSCDYASGRDLPQHPMGLVHHQLVQATAVSTSSEWHFEENEKPLSVRAEPRIRMNTNDAVIELVSSGWGISQLLSYQISPGLSAGRLQTILEDFERPPLPIHVVHQEGRLVSAKVRAFVDYIVDHLRADKNLNPDNP